MKINNQSQQNFNGAYIKIDGQWTNLGRKTAQISQEAVKKNVKKYISAEGKLVTYLRVSIDNKVAPVVLTGADSLKFKNFGNESEQKWQFFERLFNKAEISHKEFNGRPYQFIDKMGESSDTINFSNSPGLAEKRFKFFFDYCNKVKSKDVVNS